MTNSVPCIFDRALIRTRAHRVAKNFIDADFLRARATSELAERLALVNRRFERAGLIGMSARHIAEHAVFADALDACDIYNDPDANGAQIDEESLPFAAGAYDLLIFGWGLHSVNDLPGVLVQAMRALRPDGLLLACLLGGETLAELRAVLTQAETERIGGLAAHLHPTTDIRDLGNLLQRVGFALSVADTTRIMARYSSLLALMRDLQKMGESNVLMRRSRAPLRRDVIAYAERLYRAQFADTDGRLLARFDLQFLLGWSPHPDQPQPLRPGSAKTRLADALGTEEIALDELAQNRNKR